MYRLYLILINITIIFADSNEVKINTNHGPIIGRSQLIENKEIHEFLGIPYAQPPVGNLRFKKPLPVKSWTNPLNATSWPNICYQKLQPGAEVWYNNANMSEDCLYLNIMTPKSDGHLKPVMVWIHGGAFLVGAAGLKLYTPELLVSRGDIIGVGIDYRLSTLGYLYTGTNDAPGNVGIYDQVLALKWIKENIESFGGDPNQITIYGVSAGSVSVSLHILSPLSRNLYKNAIMMSGAVLNHLTGEDPEIAKKGWVKGAKIAGCGNGINFTAESIECLMKMDPNKLVLIPEYKELVTEPTYFIPLLIYGDELLPKKPGKMLENGDYKKNFSLLTGTTDDEGSFILTVIDPEKYGPKSKENMTYHMAFNELTQLSDRLKSNIKIKSSDIVKTYFMGVQSNNSDKLRNAIGVAIGDFYLLCPTLLFAKGIYRNDYQNRVYQYQFTRKPLPTDYCQKWQGTCHGMDVMEWFGVPFKAKELYTDDDRKHSTDMMNLLINFSKHGVPTPQDGIEWPQYYTIHNETVAPYYEFTHKPKSNGNFATDLKHVECDVLWKPYIDNQ